jgi:hypothetical protein
MPPPGKLSFISGGKKQSEHERETFFSFFWEKETHQFQLDLLFPLPHEQAI